MSLFSIRSDGGTEIEVCDTIPDTMKVLRLRDAVSIYAHGRAGQFAFQKISFPGGDWWYSNYQPAYDLQLIGEADMVITEFYNALTNHFPSTWDGIGVPTQQQYQFGLSCTPYVKNTATLTGGVIYETMDFHPDMQWLIDNFGNQSRTMDHFIDAMQQKNKVAHVEGCFLQTTFMRELLRRVSSPDCNEQRLKIQRDALTGLFVDEAISQFEPITKPPVLKPSHIDKVKQIEKYLRDHFLDPPGIRQITREVGMNRRMVQEIFKLHTGETIDHYCRRIRIDFVKLLLLEKKDLSLTEIAWESGFSSAASMSMAFYRITGKKPGQYRKDTR